MFFEILQQYRLVLTIGALLCLTVGAMAYCIPMWRIRRACRAAKPSGKPDAALPRASVIVYSRNDAQSIGGLLESLTTQNHPDYEIIVVTDASTDGTVDIVEQAMCHHDNIKHTFVPGESHNLSRKKLAIMLGVKASTGDVIVNTTANCVIESDNWLRLMCEPFADKQTEITLGYCNTLYRKAGGVWSRYRAIDSLLTGTQWLSAALTGHPYRGDGHNLAYRKDTFFKANGFSQTIWAQNGDDDLFVNQISNSDNTAVQLAEDAIIGIECAGRGAKVWIDNKEKYMFTQHYLPRKPFMLHALGSWCYWLGTLCGIGGIVGGISSMWWWSAINGALLSAIWCCVAFSYSNTAKGLHAGRQLMTVPFTLYARPIVNALLRLRFSTRKGCNYTWRH